MTVASTGPPPRTELSAPTRERTWPLYAVLLASLFVVVGLIWDISWHRTIGRDTFWSPPHVLEQLAAVIAGLTCGWLVLYTTFAGNTAERHARAVGFWGFRSPLGAWVYIWGESSEDSPCTSHSRSGVREARAECRHGVGRQRHPVVYLHPVAFLSSTPSSSSSNRRSAFAHYGHDPIVP